MDRAAGRDRPRARAPDDPAVRRARRRRAVATHRRSPAVRTRCCCSPPTIRTGSSTATTSCPPGLPETLRRKIMVDNPLATYPRLQGGRRNERRTSHSRRIAEPARQARPRRRRHPSAREVDRGAEALHGRSAGGTICRPSASRRGTAIAKGHPYPKVQPGDGSRRDAWPPDGGLPGSDLDFMRKQHLDPYGVEIGIMNPLAPSGQGDQNRELSAALASATNEWQLETGCARSRGCKASIVVPYEDGRGLACRDRASAPATRASRMCCCCRAPPSRSGEPRYWPIYEAAVEARAADRHPRVRLLAASPTTDSGWPSFYIEEMTEHAPSCQACSPA